MKHRLFSFIALLLIVCLFTACRGNSVSETEQAVTEDNPIVATVNGEPVYYSAFAEKMVSIEAMYSAMSGTMSADELNQKLTEQANSVLDTFIAQLILEQKAEELGITLTDEQEAAVAAAWTDTQEQFRKTVSANYPTFTGEDLDAMVLLALQSSGLTEEMVTQSAKTSALIANLRAQIDAQVSPVSDSEVRETYQALLQQQQTEFANDITAFESAMLGNAVVVYIPTAHRVIHEWELRYENDVIALLNQLKQIDTEESTAYEDTLAAEQSRTQAQLEKVRSEIADGADFDALYAEKNDGAAPHINYIGAESTRFSEEYYAAAMNIDAEGSLAKKFVATNNGYMLLYWGSTLEPGVVPFETVCEQLSEQLQKEKCDENWKAVQALWREEAEITIVTDLITYS